MQVWEISHDFVARLLNHVLANSKLRWWANVRRAVIILSLVLWPILLFLLVPFVLERRAIRDLKKAGVDITYAADGLIAEVEDGADPPSTAFVKLQALPDLREVNLNDTKVSSLAPLSTLRHVERLYVERTRLTGDAFAELGRFAELRELYARARR
jgi:hypothetical protein